MSSSEAASGETKSATYDGGCHCGQVKYTMKVSPSIQETTVSDCNCSICVKNSLHYVFVKNEDVEWKSGFDALTGYQFHKKVLTHSFCPKCGTSICGTSADPSFFPGLTAINVSTVEGLDSSSLNYKKFDGRKL